LFDRAAAANARHDGVERRKDNGASAINCGYAANGL
jgi:hypothetical protein